MSEALKTSGHCRVHNHDLTKTLVAKKKKERKKKKPKLSSCNFSSLKDVCATFMNIILNIISPKCEEEENFGLFT